MQDLAQSRLASVLAVLLGIYLFLSPIWISVTGAALVSVIVVGIIFALAGLVQLFWENSSPSWLIGILAIYLFISAFAYSVSNAATWNMALSAIIGFILATWDGVEMSAVHQQHQRGAY